MNDLERLAERLRTSKSAVVLTGAGVSTESGIPDFRSASSGLWKHHDPMRVASIEGFRREPRAFYEFWGERFASLGDARPNVTHRVLAALEGRGMIRAVVTQNIDGLHTLAGSERVLEVHGSYRRARCIECGAPYETAAITARVASGRLPICDACGGLVKPDVTLFGEELPPVFAEASKLAGEADLLLVLGSSLEVQPVAGLVPDARANGAFVALINRDECAYDDLADLVIHGELGPAMRALASLLELELT